MRRQEANITIKSIKHDIDETETIQEHTGHYASLAGEHLVNYREVFDDDRPDAGVVKNLIKITPKTFSIKKSGVISSHMLFRNQTSHHSIYQTPFGQFKLMIYTKQLEIHTESEQFSVRINYDLHMNHAFVSNCTIHVQIRLL